MCVCWGGGRLGGVCLCVAGWWRVCAAEWCVGVWLGRVCAGGVCLQRWWLHACPESILVVEHLHLHEAGPTATTTENTHPEPLCSYNSTSSSRCLAVSVSVHDWHLTPQGWLCDDSRVHSFVEHDINSYLEFVRAIPSMIGSHCWFKGRHCLFQCCKLTCFVHVHRMNFYSTAKCSPFPTNSECSSPMSWSGGGTGCSPTPMSRSGGTSSNSSTCARSHVHLQIYWSSKSFTTLYALKCWKCCMDTSNMSIQGLSSREIVSAVMTQVPNRSSAATSSTRIRFDWNTSVFRPHVTMCTLKISHRG